jgi:hypothetical protein
LLSARFKAIAGIFSKVMTEPGETTVCLYSFTHFTYTEVCFNCKIYFFFTCAITVGRDVMVSLLEVSYVSFLTLLNVVWTLVDETELSSTIPACSNISGQYLKL